MEEKHFEINRASWNERAEIHYGSDFYNVIEFKKNKNSLNPIELELLGSVEGKKYFMHFVISDKIVYH